MKVLRFVSSMLLAVVVVSALIPGGRLAAVGQGPTPVPQPPLVTLKVTVVISRFENDKKVGSLPFVLMVVPGQVVAMPGNNPPAGVDGEVTSIQMAADVPVPVASVTPSGAVLPSSYQYRSVGTNINAYAKYVDEGRYNIYVNVTDSQIMADVGKAGAARTDPMPAFQSFKSNNRLVLRDGQTVQYTAATDKSSGEVVKLDVTLNVIK